MFKNYNLKLVARVLTISTIILFTFSSMAASAFPFREFKEGDPVPDVTLTSMETGSPKLTFSGQKGAPFIVIFWGADLPEKIEYSAKILGEIEELVPFLNKRNVQRYSVNVQNDDSAAIQEVVSKSKSSIGIYKDENLKAYATLGIYVIPAVLLVDGKGNVAAGMGYSRDLVDRLKGSIEIMLGEKTPEQVAAELRPEMTEASDDEKKVKRHFGYGIVMIKRGQFDAAIREFAKVIEIDPGMNNANLQLGRLYLGKGDSENAETAISKLLEAEPDSIQGNVYQGEILRIKKQFAQADELLKTIISAHPEKYDAHYYLGRVSTDMKKDREAMESYKKAYKSILNYSVRNE